MRKILFRAKRKNWRDLPKKEWWAEGHFFDDGFQNPEHYFVGGIEIVPYRGTADDEWNITGTYFCEIDPETLCQFTGMVDKNGKRIWENDIISINTYDYMEPQEDFFGQVVYSEGWACWCIQHPDDERPIPLCECEGSYQTDRFIGGNIFDNPELLGQDGEES